MDDCFVVLFSAEK